MYAIEWALYSRHNSNKTLTPFLFEWEKENLSVKEINSSTDRESFAYNLIQKPHNKSDQFVFCYEGFLTDELGKTHDAIVAKGYDVTQEKGVFLAQAFEPIEKNGIFSVSDRLFYVNNPELPFKPKTNIKPNYSAAKLGGKSQINSNVDFEAIFSHDNPALISNGVKNYIESAVENDYSEIISGRIKISLVENFSDKNFFQFSVLRAIQEAKNSKAVRNWEKNNNKRLYVNCEYENDIWLKEFDESSKDIEKYNYVTNSFDQEVTTQNKKKYINKNLKGNKHNNKNIEKLIISLNKNWKTIYYTGFILIAISIILLFYNLIKILEIV
jgi:hypothetical protein